MMETIHTYHTKVKWDNDRIGTLSSNELPVNIQVATPPEFPKGVKNIWSPEHLFAASINVCLMTTFLAIADNSNLGYVSYEADAEAKLEKIDGKFIISEVELKPVIKVKEEKDKERALRIIEKAEANCLISNSAKSKIILNPIIII